MNTLDWRNKDQWIKEIQTYAGHLLNTSLLDQLKSNNITSCWADNMSWLPDEDIVNLCKEAFLSHYSHIKAFHGCRPKDVSSYYKSGILGQNGSNIENEFRELFIDANNELVEKSILELHNRKYQEKGKVFFVCNHKDLVGNGSGHYLIQGSEYLLCLAARLTELDTGLIDHKMRLRNIGTPTVFEVNIALSSIDDYQITDLIQTIIASWGSYFLCFDDPYDYEMSFVLNSDLPSEFILNHFHPKKIEDPHSNHILYIPNTTKCEMCI